MTAKEILEKINNGEVFNIIDVRQKDRYEQFHLPGAVWVEKGKMFEDVNWIIKDKTHKWFVTCNGGNSAGMIAAYLKEKGYDVESIEGGMSTVVSEGA